MLDRLLIAALALALLAAGTLAIGAELLAPRRHATPVAALTSAGTGACSCG